VVARIETAVIFPGETAGVIIRVVAGESDKQIGGAVTVVATGNETEQAIVLCLSADVDASLGLTPHIIVDERFKNDESEARVVPFAIRLKHSTRLPEVASCELSAPVMRLYIDSIELSGAGCWVVNGRAVIDTAHAQWHQDRFTAIDEINAVGDDGQACFQIVIECHAE
jgi:hypothetical protein